MFLCIVRFHENVNACLDPSYVFSIFLSNCLSLGVFSSYSVCIFLIFRLTQLRPVFISEDCLKALQLMEFELDPIFIEGIYRRVVSQAGSVATAALSQMPQYKCS